MNFPNGYHITLTPSEIATATAQGAVRYTNARACGFQHGTGFVPHGAIEDIDGRAAELACAKLLGVFIGTFDLQQDILRRHEGDVAGYEVRHTRLARGCLIIRPSDPDSRAYILVTGTLPDLRVVGWIRGEEAKQDLWLKAPNGRPAAYFVPQAALNDMGNLIEIHLKRGSAARHQQ